MRRSNPPCWVRAPTARHPHGHFVQALLDFGVDGVSPVLVCPTRVALARVGHSTTTCDAERHDERGVLI